MKRIFAKAKSLHQAWVLRRMNRRVAELEDLLDLLEDQADQVADALNDLYDELNELERNHHE